MKFLFIIFLFPLQLFAQDITGVWTGTLYNDTTKQYIKYELAISEYNGKLSGYSHTIFVIDSVENIGVKSIKIKQEGEIFFITDEKLVYNNYPEPPAKGVKQFSTLLLSQNDTAMILRGSWNTNRTKEYSKLTGEIFLQKKKNIKESLIIAKLENLGVAHSLSFISSTPLPANDLAIVNKTQLPNKLEKPNIISSGDSGPQKTIFSKKEDDKVDTEKKMSKETSDISLRQQPGGSDQKLKPGDTGTQNLSALENKKSEDISSKLKDKKKAEQNKTTNGITNQSLTKSNIDSSSKSREIISSMHSEINPAELNKQNGISNDVLNKDAATSAKEKSKTEGQNKNQKDISAIDLKRQNIDSSKAVKAISSSPPVNVLVADETGKLKNMRHGNFTDSRLPKEDIKKIEEVKPLEEQIKNQSETPERIVKQQKNDNTTKAEEKVVPQPAAEIATRKIETIRTVEIKQDSLLLTLYDNGEIDGDTVSVLLNGKVIMPMQGLMARAINKTIYLTPEMGDSIVLVMYAENLGSIPPNTGLLVVHDGDDVYEIRFTGDMQKNSAIILKRKKKK